MMLTIKRLILPCVLILSTLLFSGCTRVQQGAAIGGGAGAAVGGIWAANGGILVAGEGLFTGLAAGGLAGALIADQLEDDGSYMDNSQMQAEIDNLKRQLAAKDALLADARAKGSDTSEVDSLKSRIRDLEDRLKKQIEQQKAVPVAGSKDIMVQSSAKGIEYTILGGVLFKSGSDEISDSGKEILSELAETLKANYGSNEISIEGHADDVPIQHSEWSSNWELGAHRALAVLNYMIDQHGFDGGKVSATTFGEFRPVEENSDSESRAKNRRAVIVVKPN